jgi:hypothetical protein
LPISALRKGFDNLHHRFPGQHARDAVGHGGHDFPAAAGGQVGEDEVNNGPADVSKSVAVEEEKRSAAVAVPQEFYGFGERLDGRLFLLPFCFNRRIALLILAVLRASSCARSSVEADDKVPTPVFEKLGSGL